MRPTARIAIISSEVATGRRMKMREGFMRLPRRALRGTRLSSSRAEGIHPGTATEAAVAAVFAACCSCLLWRTVNRSVRRQFHLRAVAQAIAPLGHDDITHRHAREHAYGLTVSDPQLHRHDSSGAVVLDAVYKGAVDAVGRASMHCRRRHENLVAQRILQQLDVDELVR